MTAEDQLAQEVKTLGCTSAEIDAEVERYGFDHPQLKVAMSTLSDAQAELEHYFGNKLDADHPVERARQAMNRAKYLIDQAVVLLG